MDSPTAKPANNPLEEQVIFLGWVLGGCKNILEDVAHIHEVYRGYVEGPDDTEGYESEMVEENDLKDDDKCVKECVACRSSRLLTWVRGQIPPKDWRQHGMVPDDWKPPFMEAANDAPSSPR